MREGCAGQHLHREGRKGEVWGLATGGEGVPPGSRRVTVSVGGWQREGQKAICVRDITHSAIKPNGPFYSPPPPEVRPRPGNLANGGVAAGGAEGALRGQGIGGQPVVCPETLY